MLESDSIYLDFNATSPLSLKVQAWLKCGDVAFANPASQHTNGKASRKIINEARAALYRAFSKTEKDNRLFFHSGATEAFFSFAYSFCEMARRSGRHLLICCSRIDHPAVTSLAERFWGEHVDFFDLKLRPDLSYDHESNLLFLKERKNLDHGLIILYHHLWVHNETGLVSALSELTVFKEIPDLYLHVDAVQSPGKVPEWRSPIIGDIWSYSAHKFGALKGIGFSFVREGTPYHPLFMGGGQQHGLRGGTENPMAVKSIALALEDILNVDVDTTTQLRNELVDFMDRELGEFGHVLKTSPHNSNTIYFYLTHMSSDIALALFDVNGLAISAGSACSSGAARPSAVLTQLGLHDVAKNGLRLSLGTSVDEKTLNIVKTRLLYVFSKLKF